MNLLRLRRLVYIAVAIVLFSACSSEEDDSPPDVIDLFVAQFEQANRAQATCNFEIDREGDISDDAVATKFLNDSIACLSEYRDSLQTIEAPHEFRENYQRIRNDLAELIDVDSELMNSPPPQSDEDFETRIELLDESMDLFTGIKRWCREIEREASRPDELHCPALFEPLGPDHPFDSGG